METGISGDVTDNIKENETVIPDEAMPTDNIMHYLEEFKILDKKLTGYTQQKEVY